MYNKIYNILKSVPNIKVRTYDYSVYQVLSWQDIYSSTNDIFDAAIITQINQT